MEKKRAPGASPLTLIVAILIFLILAEIAIRLASYYDADGNIFFLSRKLRPYKIPLISTEKKIKEYLNSSDSFTVYDRELGWTNRPKSSSRDGLNNSDRYGIRTASAGQTPSIIPRPGVFRIAIFGDSYTFGAGLPFEETWGYHLESALKQAGINAEVLNFGVSAYGMDQAFLRWKKLGRRLSPQIVIFGFQPENMKRNVNIIRPLYFPETGVPFSKPRYIIEADGLKLLNVPTLPPEKLVDVLEDIGSWELAEHEYWLGSKNYQESIWLKSRLIAFILYAWEDKSERFAYRGAGRDFYYLDSEPAQLTLKIIEAFKEDVHSSGGEFYVVHLPFRRNLNTLLRGERLLYAEVLAALEESATVVHPENGMLDQARKTGVAQLYNGSHYSPAANAIIAKAVTQHLLLDYFR